MKQEQTVHKLKIPTFWTPITNRVPRDILGPPGLIWDPQNYLGPPGLIWDPRNYLEPPGPPEIIWIPHNLFGTSWTI